MAALGGFVVGAWLGSPMMGLVLAGVVAALALMAQRAPRRTTAPSSDASALQALRQQVQRLEARVRALEGEAPQPAAAAHVLVMPESPMPVPMPAPEPMAPEPVAEAQPVPEPTAPPPRPEPWVAPRPPQPPPPPPVPWRDRLPAPLRDFLFGGNTLVKVGVLLLFLGLAFLLRYTAERVSVPLPLRYSGVALAGVALLALGWWLRERRRGYALILQGAGIGVLNLTVLGAMKLHGLIEPGQGFAVLLAIALLSAALAVLQNAMALAVVAALEGFAAPVLMGSGSDSPVGLLGYLLVLDLGVLAMAWFKAWRPLHLIAFVGTATLATGWVHTHALAPNRPVLQGFLIAFTLLFSAIGLLFARRTLQDAPPPAADASLGQRAGQVLRQVGRVDSALVFGVPLTAYALQYLLVREQPLGPALAAVGFGLFQLALARLALAPRQPGLALLAESYAVVAVLFGTLAIPLGLEGRWTGAAWAVEAAGMYWLGLRQQRPYARVFALAVMVGATVKLLGDIAPNSDPAGPWLSGPLLGPLLLAGAAATLALLRRRAEQTATVDDSGVLAQVERLGVGAMPWLTAAALALLPWMTLPPALAPVGLAALAAGGTWLAARLARQGDAAATRLTWVSAAQHGAAVLGFLATLHAGDGVPLHGGLQTLASALAVAAGLLWALWGWLRRAWAAPAEAPPATLAQQVAVVVVAGLLALAPLAVWPGEVIGWLWPLLALPLLAVALRLRLALPGAAAFALLVLAAPLHLYFGPLEATPRWLANAAFLIWLWHALAWLVAAGLLDRARHLPAWLRAAPLAVGLLGWVQVWAHELQGALDAALLLHWGSGALVLMLLATGALMRGAARVRAWPQMANASWAVLPAVACVAAVRVLPTLGWPMVPPPSTGLGWLAWPLALGWHLWLLRRPGAEPGLARTAWHVGGLWLFVLLATREVQQQLAPWSGLGDGWQAALMLAVPLAVLYGLAHPAMRRRWPVQANPATYLNLALVPLALAALLWLLGGGLLHPGDAAPLPYLPLLNPLELSLAAAALGLWQWQRALPADAPLRLPARATRLAVALPGLLLLTGAVLRACHHLADVPWTAQALFASRLTQAALSLTWTAAAVCLMVLANRRSLRAAWLAGAALLGVVVAKLFFVELADQGGIWRIVSFLGVGALLLLVGYLAPVPARREERTA
ncbi:MAG: DUF2339 domain-containing protein [Proteobacteria bacterium]|nr:DUF2339 domain-containing protein [Pseudomonadota bacterium]